MKISTPRGSRSKNISSENRMDESFSSEFSNSMDDDNLSQLDTSRSEDFSGGAGSSSGGPHSEKQMSHVSDGSKVLVNF